MIGNILDSAKSLKQKPRWINTLHKICLNLTGCKYLWSHHNLNLLSPGQQLDNWKRLAEMV